MQTIIRRGLVFAAACCALLPLAGARIASAADPLVIPVMLSTTGPAAFVGSAELSGLKVLEKLVNDRGGVRGRPISFQFLDDQSNPQIAVQLENGLLDKKPVVILGPSVTGTCAAVEPLVRDAGPVQYCFSPGLSPKPKSFMFAGSRSLDASVGPQIKYASEKGYTRAALIVATDASGQAAQRAFLANLPQFKKVQLVDKEEFLPADINISAAIARVKAAKPQIVFLFATGPAFGNAIRTLSAAGVDVPIVSSSANKNKEQLDPLAAYMPPELLFDGFAHEVNLSSNNKRVRDSHDEFVSAFKAQNVTPGSSIAFAWDPARIVISAYQKFGFGMTVDQLHGYMEDLHDFGGLNGLYDFRAGDQHGLGWDSLVIVRWEPKGSGLTAASGPGGIPQ